MTAPTTPPATERALKAPPHCQHVCADSADCSNVEVCRAVANLYAPADQRGAFGDAIDPNAAWNRRKTKDAR